MFEKKKNFSDISRPSEISSIAHRMARQSCPSAQDAVFVYWHGCCLRGQCPRSPPSPNEESAVSAERHGDPAVPRRAATRLRAGTTPGVATFAPLTKSWRRGNIWERNTFLRTTPSTLPRPDAACAPCARFEACQVTCAATPGHPRHVSAKDAKSALGGESGARRGSNL